MTTLPAPGSQQSRRESCGQFIFKFRPGPGMNRSSQSVRLTALDVVVGLLLASICSVVGTSVELATTPLDVIMPRHETHTPDRSFSCSRSR